MNILVVTQYFWPEDFRINDLAAGLVEKGHRVMVLTGIPNYPAGRFFPGYGIFKNSRQTYRGADIVRVPLVPRGNGSKIRLFFNYLSFSLLAAIMAPFLIRGNFDLIFVYEPSPVTVGLPAIWLKKIKSAPLLFWVQDLWPESLSATGAVRSSMILKFVNKLVCFIYRRCDLILVQSRGFISSVQSFGVDISRIIYFPNSAEGFYRPVERSADLEERKAIPQGFIVMFAGNIGNAQDFDTIISAAEKIKDHKDIYWVIIGDGRERIRAEKEITTRKLNSNFLFLGRHPAEKMPNYFALADALLVTLKNEDIFKLTVPSKLQSYLASAKPVIASLSGEGARIVEESGAGVTCQPEDPDALARSVLKVYHMQDGDRRAMGLKGREYFMNNFERSMLLGQLDKIIKDVRGGMA